MRLIVLDTETTGLNPKTGDRIIEIGCVELVNRRLTGNNLHFYLNPERDSDPGALAVHGLTTEFLSDKPKFAEVAAEFRNYVQDAGIIIHNAPFDVGFLDAEFALLGLSPFGDYCGEVIDTLVDAKRMFPGKRNSLDALCERFDINNGHRTLHGALLDAELLAEVYLAMTRGQESLVIDMLGESSAGGDAAVLKASLAAIELTVLAAADDEQSAHQAVLDELDRVVKGSCVWRTDPAPAADATGSASDGATEPAAAPALA